MNGGMFGNPALQNVSYGQLHTSQQNVSILGIPSTGQELSSFVYGLVEGINFSHDVSSLIVS